jgi:HAD superfamily phosphoserine phosphatase-like hydrolase
MQSRAVDMVVFDVDGTLIVHPSGKVVWQHLSQCFGTPPEVNRQRLEDHLAGRLPYSEWVRLDIEDWRDAGAQRDDIVTALRDFELRPGVTATLTELGARGYRLAAVSGTLDVLIDTMLPEHPFERIYSNRIIFAPNGAITGWRATPFDFDGKARALRELSHDLSIALERMAFVGDDINDIDAARAAGFSIAFHPRAEALAEQCDLVLRNGSLEQILAHLP